MIQHLTVGAPASTALSAGTPSDELKAQSSNRVGRWVMGAAALLVVVLAGALVAVTLPRLRHTQELEAAAAQSASDPPRVAVGTARLAPATSELNLPGNALAFRESAMYARTTGYLIHWTADIGDRVPEGQVIAEISAPDVDDQLAQAKANLVLAKANLRVSEANLVLAKITLARDIAAGSAVSQQTVDQDRALVESTDAQVGSAKASIEVNEATVKQFLDLVSFQKIVAPFRGVITVRNVDPGALVTADNPSETRELFHIMQINPLRVFVNVPQVNAMTIAPGQTAIVYRQEDPVRLFSGKVTRAANALDPNTRTLLTEVDVPNPDDALRPGMYLRVKFVSSRSTPSVLIPAAGVVTRNDGPEVALLDDNNTVRYRKVQLGRDYGAEMEVVTGLKGGETVIVHPGDALKEGQKVEPAQSPK
jgi:RND family efflux transporter MFP subunit